MSTRECSGGATHWPRPSSGRVVATVASSRARMSGLLRIEYPRRPTPLARFHENSPLSRILGGSNPYLSNAATIIRYSPRHSPLFLRVKNGYREVSVPLIVSRTTLTGTGQLPKFEEDLFAVNHKVRRAVLAVGRADPIRWWGVRRMCGGGGYDGVKTGERSGSFCVLLRYWTTWVWTPVCPDHHPAVATLTRGH
jgi:hypothetical protein